METCALHDKGEIEAFLRKNVYLHIYSIGDLDDFFWHKTIWYGSKTSDQIQAIAMLYTEPPLPTLHAMGEQHEPIAELIRSIFHLLPGRFHAHLSPGLCRRLSPRWQPEALTRCQKMFLTRPERVAGIETDDVERLSPADLPQLQAFFAIAYPDNWFDPRMLETGQYFGIRRDGNLQSVAGIHVYSRRYRVAALGNIATVPGARGLGLAGRVTARLCRSLLADVDAIGLNVHADNRAAIACYRRLGFDVIASYEEVRLNACDGLSLSI